MPKEPGGPTGGRGITGERLTSYGDAAFTRYLRGAFAAGLGLGRELREDRPAIGIADTSIGVQSCHARVPEIVAAVERGILVAGGLPIRFPTVTLPEIFTYPTSMYLRNLMALDTEEMLRALPIQAAVLVGGCDKTVPAQLMGAISADLPFLELPVGPMASGAWRDETLGACTDCRRFWRSSRAGAMSDEDLAAAQEELVPGPGTCTVMGTASSMAAIAEALGTTLPGAATAPSVSAERLRIAEASGAAAVRLAIEGRRPSAYLTPASFRNAARALVALGGSTNAVIHLVAMARRAGYRLTLDEFDAIGRATPTLADMKPHGRFQMADLHRVGGVPLLLSRLAPLLEPAMTATGEPVVGAVPARADAVLGAEVIRPLDRPFKDEGGIAVLRGSLAPAGAVIKPHAATPRLLAHRGRAVVFDSIADAEARLETAPIEPDDILVLRNAGLRGAPGMPEAGILPIPRRLAAAGVTDMVRISDARMSGTGFGTVVLHVAPEAAVGGPLALVRDGDLIELDVAARRLELLVDPAELATREPSAHPVTAERGWARLFAEHVVGPDEGADLDLLMPPAG